MERGIQDEWAQDSALGETHDELLRRRVVDDLAAEELLDSVDIEVSVVGGDVVLQGMVNTESQRKQAEAVASSAGASSVRNELRVRGQ
jgi:osmotically-inducible protein OsmY